MWLAIYRQSQEGRRKKEKKLDDMRQGGRKIHMWRAEPCVACCCEAFLAPLLLFRVHQPETGLAGPSFIRNTSRPVVHYVMLPVPLPPIRVQQNLATNQTPTWNETLTSTPSPRHLRPQPPSKRFPLSNDFISRHLSSFSDPSIHLLKRYCPIDICLSSDKRPSRWLANFGTCLRASLPPSSTSFLCITGSFRHRLATRKAIGMVSHYILLHD